MTYSSCKPHPEAMRTGFAVSAREYTSPRLEMWRVDSCEGYAKSNEVFGPGDEIKTPLNNTYYD